MTLVPVFICDLSLYKNYKTKRQYQHTHNIPVKITYKLDKRYINRYICATLLSVQIYERNMNKYFKHWRDLRLRDCAGKMLKITLSYSKQQILKLGKLKVSLSARFKGCFGRN